METTLKLSEAIGEVILYRYANISASGVSQELVLIGGREEIILSIEGGRQEASASMSPAESRKLAGALLDAADALENAARSGSKNFNSGL